MKWFCAAMFVLILLTPMVGSLNVAGTAPVETSCSWRLFSERCAEIMDYIPLAVSIYLLSDNGSGGDANNTGDEAGEENEKELEADPAGGVDRIWNTVQLA